ncbi:phosphoenolpyruvate carboxykinase (ATP) [Natronobiforma cellulositropha]|uniref:hypothetical protein n=1 Tax=Natronobiforma cellulositropha TaxID=1679076 RepID=UPI0021D5CD55|nr:hypothetical protein [Natronobiforma cellulositropha]
MNYYEAYGMTLESAFEMPELPRAERVETPDVEIRRGEVEPVSEWVEGEGGRRIQADGDVCRLSYETIGSFRVAKGREVVFDPVSEEIPTMKLFRRLIQNEMMGVLAHQRGLLVLHASAVAVDGRAAVFLGPRRAGKSTTAAAFHTHGHTLIEDDVVGIRFDEDGPVVVPGVPQLRLLPDAADALAVASAPAPTTDDGSGKRYERVDPVPEPVPLAGCYVLEEGETLELAPVPAREQLFGLIAKTYVAGLLDETGTTAANFEQCSTVVETTPVQRLCRPKRHEVLPALVDLVATDLEAAASDGIGHRPA